MPRYSIKKNRLKSGYIEGFGLRDDGSLGYRENEHFHVIFLSSIDGIERGAQWGRLSFDIQLSGNAYYYVYVCAVNEKIIGIDDSFVDADDFITDADIPYEKKLALLNQMGARRITSKNDILLYDLSGRYLFVAVQVAGEGSANISDMVVDSTGDNFMASFPQIYQERNSFFHRYMSVFSSVYNDFQRDIDKLPDLLDLDTCPEELLVTYGSWMGIDLAGGFLDPDVMRSLVKEAYDLNRMKGTTKALKRITEIMLKKEVTVVEHNALRMSKKDEESHVPSGFEVRGLYDVTILVDMPISEELRHQLFYILDQFKPARTIIDIVRMDETITMDSNTFLDMNARLPEAQGGALDEHSTLDGVIMLT